MWNERYSEPGYAFGSSPNTFVVSVAGRIPSGAVLCIGEGEGRNAVFLAEQGYRVTAVDYSEVGLRKAEELAGKRGVIIETVLSDLNDFEIYPSAWQGIVSVFCHLPADQRASLHRLCVNGLAPGGFFVLEGFTPRQLEFGTGGPSRPELLMTSHGLKRELAGLRFDIAHEIERDVIEGRYHTGRASVVQILAQKSARN